jgi:hypothetical protein
MNTSFIEFVNVLSLLSYFFIYDKSIDYECTNIVGGQIKQAKKPSPAEEGIMKQQHHPHVKHREDMYQASHEEPHKDGA